MLTQHEALIAARSLVEVYTKESEHLGHILRVANGCADIEWFGMDAPESSQWVPLSEVIPTVSARAVIDSYKGR